MCNRGRKLLLFNDFLVAPTTIVRERARNDRAPTTLSRPVCTVDTHFSLFFLSFVLYLLLNRNTAASYELHYCDRYSMSSPFNAILIVESDYSHIANIREDRSSYRFNCNIVIFKNFFSIEFSFELKPDNFISEAQFKSRLKKGGTTII